jgi:hypothetical protein
VLRARYEDARFFYNNDLAKPLDELRPSLAGITFETKLGNMLAKADRVKSLVASVGALIGTGPGDLEVAAEAALVRSPVRCCISHCPGVCVVVVAPCSTDVKFNSHSDRVDIG